MPTFPTIVPDPVVKTDEQGQLQDYMAQQPPLGADVAQQAFRDYTNSLPPLEDTVKDVMQGPSADSTPPVPNDAISQGISQADQTLVQMARDAATKAGIDPNLFSRQIYQESGFNPNAHNPSGASGIAQLMPQYYGNVNAYDPRQALDAAAQTMAGHLADYQGDWSKALAAYNAGAGNLARYGLSGVLNDSFANGETKRYVANILGGGGFPPVGSAAPSSSSTPAAAPISGVPSAPPSLGYTGRVAGSTEDGTASEPSPPSPNPLQAFQDYASTLGQKLSDTVSQLFGGTSVPSYNDMAGASSSYTDTNQTQPTGGISAIDQATSPLGPQVGDTSALPLSAVPASLSDWAASQRATNIGATDAWTKWQLGQGPEPTAEQKDIAQSNLLNVGMMPAALEGAPLGAASSLAREALPGMAGAKVGNTLERLVQTGQPAAQQQSGPLSGVGHAVNELLAPAKNTAPEVQNALATFTNTIHQGAVDADTIRREIEATLGKRLNTADALAELERSASFGANATPEQQALAQRLQAFTDATRQQGMANGYISGDVTAGPNAAVQMYVPRIYDQNVKPGGALGAARKNLSPNDFYSNARVFPTLTDAQAAGFQPINSVSAPFAHYANRIATSEAKVQLVNDLKNASPAAVMDYTPGQRLPAGWVPGFASDPILSGHAFPEPVARAINNITRPSSYQGQTIVRNAMNAMHTGMQSLFSLSGFHYLTELRQGFNANNPLMRPDQAVTVVGKAFLASVDPALFNAWRLHDAATWSQAARDGVTGLAPGQVVLDTGKGLTGLGAMGVRSGVGALAGASAGYGSAKAAGANDQDALKAALVGGGVGALSGPLQKPMMNALWERAVPTLKVMTYGLKTAQGMDGKEAAAFVNNTFGGQNLAAIARSPTVQDSLRVTMLAPDWWESWLNQAASAFRGGDLGKMSRSYWASTAITTAFTLEGLNLAINGHFTDQNEPDHRFDLEITPLVNQMGGDVRDPKTGELQRTYAGIVPPPLLSMLNAVTGMGHGDFTTGLSRFALGRLGLPARTAVELIGNRDYRGQPINPPFTPLPQAILNQGSNVLSQVAPIGSQSANLSEQGRIPAPLAAASAITGLPITHPSTAAFTGPQLNDRSRQILNDGNVQWTPTPVSDQVNGIGLTRDERTAYQEAVNAQTDKFLAQVSSGKGWANLSPAQKKDIIDKAMPAIHAAAGAIILRSIPPQERQARLQISKGGANPSTVASPFAKYAQGVATPTSPFAKYANGTAASPFAKYANGAP